MIHSYNIIHSNNRFHKLYNALVTAAIDDSPNKSNSILLNQNANTSSDRYKILNGKFTYYRYIVNVLEINALVKIFNKFFKYYDSNSTSNNIFIDIENIIDDLIECQLLLSDIGDFNIQQFINYLNDTNYCDLPNYRSTSKDDIMCGVAMPILDFIRRSIKVKYDAAFSNSDDNSYWKPMTSQYTSDYKKFHKHIVIPTIFISLCVRYRYIFNNNIDINNPVRYPINIYNKVFNGKDNINIFEVNDIINIFEVNETMQLIDRLNNDNEDTDIKLDRFGMLPFDMVLLQVRYKFHTNYLSSSLFQYAINRAIIHSDQTIMDINELSCFDFLNPHFALSNNYINNLKVLYYMSNSTIPYNFCNNTEVKILEVHNKIINQVENINSHNKLYIEAIKNIFDKCNPIIDIKSIYMSEYIKDYKSLYIHNETKELNNIVNRSIIPNEIIFNIIKWYTISNITDINATDIYKNIYCSKYAIDMNINRFNQLSSIHDIPGYTMGINTINKNLCNFISVDKDIIFKPLDESYSNFILDTQFINNMNLIAYAISKLSDDDLTNILEDSIINLYLYNINILESFILNFMIGYNTSQNSNISWYYIQMLYSTIPLMIDSIINLYNNIKVKIKPRLDDWNILFKTLNMIDIILSFKSKSFIFTVLKNKLTDIRKILYKDMGKDINRISNERIYIICDKIPQLMQYLNQKSEIKDEIDKYINNILYSPKSILNDKEKDMFCKCFLQSTITKLTNIFIRKFFILKDNTAVSADINLNLYRYINICDNTISIILKYKSSDIQFINHYITKFIYMCKYYISDSYDRTLLYSLSERVLEILMSANVLDSDYIVNILFISYLLKKDMKNILLPEYINKITVADAINCIRKNITLHNNNVRGYLNCNNHIINFISYIMTHLDKSQYIHFMSDLPPNIIISTNTEQLRLFYNINIYHSIRNSCANDCDIYTSYNEFNSIGYQNILPDSSQQEDFNKFITKPILYVENIKFMNEIIYHSICMADKLKYNIDIFSDISPFDKLFIYLSSRIIKPVDNYTPTNICKSNVFNKRIISKLINRITNISVTDINKIIYLSTILIRYNINEKFLFNTVLYPLIKKCNFNNIDLDQIYNGIHNNLFSIFDLLVNKNIIRQYMRNHQICNDSDIISINTVSSGDVNCNRPYTGTYNYISDKVPYIKYYIDTNTNMINIKYINHIISRRELESNVRCCIETYMSNLKSFLYNSITNNNRPVSYNLLHEYEVISGSENITNKVRDIYNEELDYILKFYSRIYRYLNISISDIIESLIKNDNINKYNIISNNFTKPIDYYRKIIDEVIYQNNIPFNVNSLREYIIKSIKREDIINMNIGVYGYDNSLSWQSCSYGIVISKIIKNMNLPRNTVNYNKFNNTRSLYTMHECAVYDIILKSADRKYMPLINNIGERRYIPKMDSIQYNNERSILKI